MEYDIDDGPDGGAGPGSRSSATVLSMQPHDEDRDRRRRTALLVAGGVGAAVLVVLLGALLLGGGSEPTTTAAERDEAAVAAAAAREGARAADVSTTVVTGSTAAPGATIPAADDPLPAQAGSIPPVAGPVGGRGGSTSPGGGTGSGTGTGGSTGGGSGGGSGGGAVTTAPPTTAAVTTVIVRGTYLPANNATCQPGGAPVTLESGAGTFTAALGSCLQVPVGSGTGFANTFAMVGVPQVSGTYTLRIGGRSWQYSWADLQGPLNVGE